MSRPSLTVLLAITVTIGGCGQVVPPSAASVTKPVARTPVPALLGTIQPLTCEDAATGIVDYVSGAVGVPDIVAATQATEAIHHSPEDRIVVEGNRTAIVHDGQTIYVAEWQKSDAGGWLLYTYTACQGPPASPVSGPNG